MATIKKTAYYDKRFSQLISFYFIGDRDGSAKLKYQ